MPTGPRREILIVLPGLLLTLIIAMLDQLVVSTALPRIVGDLGGLNHLAWVVTAYILASTDHDAVLRQARRHVRPQAVPDDRHRALPDRLGAVRPGALDGPADRVPGLQGLGAGGLMVGAIATIGDMVSPRERGQYMGYMMAAMMVAMIAGPLVGGYITDSLSWRWIFYINMPIGGAALIYLWSTLHLPRRRVEHKIDYLGAGGDRGRRHRDRAADQLGRHPVRLGLLGDHDAGGHHRRSRSPRSSWSRPGRPSRCCRCTCSRTATSRWPRA